jgi:hypothetical protein
MRPAAYRSSALRLVAGFALVLTARAASAELVVTTLVPARHTSVAATTIVAVTFDRAVNTATVTNASFRVFGRQSGPASGGFSFSNGDKTVTFTPSAPFAAGEVVTVNLAETLTATDTTTLRTQGYAWQFNIATAFATRTFTEIDDFGNRSDPMAATRLYGAMASDLDNDGWTDLMTVNEISGDIRVFMSLGDGTGLFDSFLAPQTIGFESSPNDAGDFNNDGNVDAAIGAAISDTVSIALGAGNGMFAITQKAVGDEAHGVVVLDVDGDGDSDIVNSNRGTSNNLSLLVNDGAGNFSGPTFFDGGVNGEWGLATGDMNNDGIMDLVAAGNDGGHICALLGNGDGTFTASTPQSAGGSPWIVTVGDLNGDGFLDAATANSFSNTGGIMLGNGDGTFDPPVTVDSDAHTPSVDLGDLDGDGDLDLVLSVYGGHYWRLYTNDGTGTFTQDQELAATANPSCSILVDIDNDGDLDMALTDEIVDTVKLMLNDDGPAPPVTCPAAPAGTCREPFLAGKAFFLLKDKDDDPTDRVIWKWLSGSQTDKPEFGNPVDDESYRLCVYNGSTLLFDMSANAGPTFWSENGAGFKYRNPNSSSDGTQGVRLIAGADRKAKILVKGKGDNLAMPTLGALLGPITMQLHQSSGAVCWSATYSSPFLRQDSSIFKDRAD